MAILDAYQRDGRNIVEVPMMKHDKRHNDDDREQDMIDGPTFNVDGRVRCEKRSESLGASGGQ